MIDIFQIALNEITLKRYCVQPCFRNIYIEEYIFWQQVIQASFVKDNGTLFIIFNFIFSSLLVIFLVSGSRW